MKVRRVDFYADDWLVGTAMLDDAECGLFIRACSLIYSTGGPVSLEHLRAVSKSHGHTFTRCLKRLQTLGKLTLNDGQITNKRCANELQRATKRLVNLRKNPQTVAETSEINTVDDTGRAQAYARAQVPINKQQSTNNSEKRAHEESGSLKAEFDEWWMCYPHKVGRAAAKQKFDLARKKTDLATLLDGLRRYKATKPDDREWCNPATWLHQERWADEPAPAPGANGHAASSFDPEEIKWEIRVKRWQQDPGTWMGDLWNMPPPDDPHTRVPAAILRKYGFPDPARKGNANADEQREEAM